MNNEEYIKNSNELEFALFCIESIAEKAGVGAKKVYDALAKKSNILQSYIVPCYDILHTQGKEYIVEDILCVMKEKGVYIYV